MARNSRSFSDARDNKEGFTDERASVRCRHLRVIGVSVSLLLLWNGVCDYIYAYSPHLSGAQYFSPAVWDTIRTAGHGPHWMVLMAQTAGWRSALFGTWFMLVPCPAGTA